MVRMTILDIDYRVYPLIAMHKYALSSKNKLIIAIAYAPDGCGLNIGISGTGRKI
jgi:hypothetical protein